MMRVLLVVICGIALTLATAASAGPPLELPTLTRVASRLSGITPKRRVRVVVLKGAAMRREATRLLDREYPRDQQGYDQAVFRALGLLDSAEELRPALLAAHTRNVLGLYDPLRRVLYVRAGRSARRAALHELVHALQDQAFDLRRLSALRRGDRDAAAAAAAAVEGDAAFATQALGGRLSFVDPRRLAVSGAPISVFLGLEHEFAYTTGLRFAATLRNLGGTRAVFTALRTFPQTTKQVFHVDAFLTRELPVRIALPETMAGWSLARADTWGELDVRALLATFHVPRLDQAATGWTAGRTGLYRDAAGRESTAVVSDWESELDVAQWMEAASLYVNEAFDADTPGLPATIPCAATVCWALDGRAIAFDRVGRRTALVAAPETSAAASLAVASTSGRG